MKKLMIYLKEYWLQSVLGPLFKLFEALLELLVPLIMANIIDIGVVRADTAYILRWWRWVQRDSSARSRRSISPPEPPRARLHGCGIRSLHTSRASATPSLTHLVPRRF